MINIKPEVDLNILIVGNFNPDDITQILGIKPHEFGRGNSLIPIIKRIRKYDYWIYNLNDSDLDDVFMELEGILINFDKSEKDWFAMIEKNNIQTSLSGKIYLKGESIGFVLNSSILSLLAKLNMVIDISIE